MKYRDIYDSVMPVSKRKEERFNLFGHWIGRPISILMTMPLIKSKIKPTTITKWSVIISIAGFVFLAFGTTVSIKVIGWGCFYLWSLLDGVDGNLARCTNQCSDLGDLWDTMGGYAAMVLIYFGAGIAAFYDENVWAVFENYWLIIIGGATAVFSIFPRLIMHKKKSSNANSEAIKSISDKRNFGFINIFAMNIVSPSGFILIFLLLGIIFHLLNWFVVTYFFINLLIMGVSLAKLLKE